MKRAVAGINRTREIRATDSYTLGYIRKRLGLEGATIYVQGEELRNDTDEVFQVSVTETIAPKEAK